MSALEKASYDKDLDMYFQKNALGDNEFVIKWAKRILKQTAQGLTQFFLFMDNLEAHIQEMNRKGIKDVNGINLFGVSCATDIWQPVDGRYVSYLKALISHEFFSWLDDDKNIELCYGADSHITSSEKRILITHWVGNAYRKLLKPEYDAFRWRLFE